jgi:hypothetical protein
MKVIVTSPAEPDEIVELRMDEPNGRRRRTWRQNVEVATDNSCQRAVNVPPTCREADLNEAAGLADAARVCRSACVQDRAISDQA